jgi:4'-phosphopantetheinyl transferase
MCFLVPISFVPKTVTWSPAPSAAHTEAGFVHLWRVDLDADSLDFPADILSADELTRVARFYFARDRIRFERRRVALRLLLSKYLGRPAKELRFHYGPTGKPGLANGGSLHFSVSHSSGIALYAVADGCETGVDIERIAHHFNWRPVASQFFSARESSFLFRLPEARQIEAFFAVWTQKEAYVKARGQGLNLGLDEFEVPMLSPEKKVDGFTITNLELGSEWSAALAVYGDPLSIRAWKWTGS